MYSVVEFITAILLGVIEGLTEFLPISSTAHLILAQEYLPIHSVPNEIFDVIIQLGSLIAFIYIRKEFIVSNIFGLLQNKKPSLNFLSYITIAILPAIIIGMVISKYTALLRTPFVMGISLFIGGIILIMVDKYKPKDVNDDIYKVGLKNSFVVGLAQTLAFIPGVSRSGSTIVAGILCKQSRSVAIEFSFMLGLATMIAASSYSLYKYFANLELSNLPIILAAMFSSFITSLITANFLINFLKNNGLYIFGIYRILIGLFFIFIF